MTSAGEHPYDLSPVAAAVEELVSQGYVLDTDEEPAVDDRALVRVHLMTTTESAQPDLPAGPSAPSL